MGPGSAGRKGGHRTGHARPREGILLMDSSTTAADELNWAVRAFIYAYIAANGRPPSVAEAASALDLTEEAARHAYAWLHEHHALFLAADGQSIRMAHPFSGVPTDFRVVANGRAYWANCAWDMLGIPAALHVDARIEASYADTRAPVSLTVAGDAVRGAPGAVIAFRQPFAHWYDDLIFT